MKAEIITLHYIQHYGSLLLQPPYVFEFLPIEYKRISYASSITVTDYPLQYGDYMKKCLAQYSWISVRETSAKNYLEKLLDKSVPKHTFSCNIIFIFSLTASFVF